VGILFASGIFALNSCIGIVTKKSFIVVLRNSLIIQNKMYFVVMWQDAKVTITRKMRAIAELEVLLRLIYSCSFKISFYFLIFFILLQS